MQDLEGIIQIGIYALMGTSVLWAICAVTLRNIFHAALTFTAVLIGIAGVYIALHAEFLAIVQILVYVGAVMTIVIFAIMLTEGATNKKLIANNKQSLVGAIAAIAFVTTLIKVINATQWPTRTLPDEALVTHNTQKIGMALLGHYVFPFEVLAVFLTAVLIGAIVLAKKDSDS